MANTNYTLSLEESVEHMDRKLTALDAGLAVLTAYLTSDKFADDSTVQTRDVLARLREIRSVAEDVN